MKKNLYSMNFIMTILLFLCDRPTSYGQQDIQDKTETFNVEKEYTPATLFPYF